MLPHKTSRNKLITSILQTFYEINIYVDLILKPGFAFKIVVDVLNYYFFIKICILFRQMNISYIYIYIMFL